MATTWIKALHRSGGSVAAALELRVDYARDEEKTEGGVLVDSHECDPYTAQSEFLLSKKIYEQQTGRDQGKHDVIAYHIRMSFAHGEVTAEQALALGRELAMRWTRGKHQFIVAAHTNTKNPHCHIVYNSTNLSCDGKYQDFKRSGIALRRVSDKLCIENGLSIVEKPGLSKGHNRRKYLGQNKAPTGRDKLRDLIDENLVIGHSLTEFLTALKRAGVEVKHGKQFSFKPPGSKKFFRQDSLGDDYSADAILERLMGKRIVEKRVAADSDAEHKAVAYAEARRVPSLLIDIEEKMREGKGEGYRNWATSFNLQQMSKTLMFIKERGIDSYEELCQKTDAVCADYHKRNDRCNEIETRMKEITDLQKQIGTYRKTREVYKQWLATKRDGAFYEANRADITLHIAAKNHFDSLGYGKNKKLPKMDALKQEWASLAAEKKSIKDGISFKERREKMINFITAKENATRILFGTRTPPQKSHEYGAR